jgi:hypothetical protein
VRRLVYGGVVVSERQAIESRRREWLVVVEAEKKVPVFFVWARIMALIIAVWV